MVYISSFQTQDLRLRTTKTTLTQGETQFAFIRTQQGKELFTFFSKFIKCATSGHFLSLSSCFENTLPSSVLLTRDETSEKTSNPQILKSAEFLSFFVFT